MQAYDPQDGDGALDFSEFLGSKVQGRVDWVDHQHDISRTYVIDIWIFEVCGLHHRRQTTNMYGLTTCDGNDELVIYIYIYNIQYIDEGFGSWGRRQENR